MKKRGTKGFTTIVLLLVIIGLIYYTYLNNNAKSSQEVSGGTQKDKLLNYDFENDYPKTVRETVKLHCQYLKNAYNGTFTEEELFTVNQKIRQMFDDELLEYNSQEAQLQGLKDEMQWYEDNKQKFVSYSLPEASQVEGNTVDDVDYAKMKVTIVLKVGMSTISGDEEYILRKDGEGKWKILGWQAITQGTAENKGDAE